ncbi:hypothetical protein [Massilia putida]|uniref:hypothetical protein n=1 Tax=Massilia putida TaxID=1141883 RepID=UPI000950E7F3|nr:hypothetical protein [Massilia putida]
MKRILILCLPLALLAGCLEVDQHPNWVHGMYAGKKDDRPFLRHFHNDKLSWWGAINNRNMNQNEYNRANP